MPFPASLKVITLTGDFRDGAADGSPREAVITITLPTPIRSEGDNVIIPPFEIEIETTLGAFAVELPATTDPEWIPNTAAYVVQAVFPDGWRKLWWTFPLPYDTADDILDLADVGAPNVGTPSITIRQGTTQPIPDGGYRGTWAIGTMYRVGDTVQYGSSVYGALKTSAGVTPGTDVTIWKTYPGGSGGGGAVDSVFGRSGDVSAQTGDYAVAQITGLQAALDGKQPLDSDLTAIAGLAPSNNDVVQRKAGVWTNRTPTQLKTDLVLVKGDVGLGNVDNTSDLNKPVSTATQAALDDKVNQSLVDAKGDLVVASAADTPARLAVGSDSQVLTADSSQPLGVKWATPSGGGGGTALVGTYPPQGYGFFAFPGDIGLFDNGTSTGNGQITIERLYIPAGQELAVLGVLLAGNGTYDGSGGANNGMAVYTDAGVLIEAVKPGPTVWATGGGAWKIFTLASPVAGQGSGRFVWVGLLVHDYAAGNPNIYYHNVPEVLWRGGNGVPTHRRTFYQTGVSDFPASFNPATYGNDGSGYLPLYALG